MTLPPAVMIHGLPHARAALAPGLPVTLLSAPWAACFAGIGWWRALMEAVEAPLHILDCGDAPGRALEGLRAGQRLMVLRTNPILFADVGKRLRASGGELLPAPPPALDLAAPRAAHLLTDWLSAG